MLDLLPDEPYSVPTRVRVETAIPLAVIRHDGVGLGQMDDLFGADYARLNDAADAGRLEPDGPPLAVFHGDPREAFDIEIGMPVVTAPREGDGDGSSISGSVLPAGTAMVLTHIGSYGGLGACWSRLAREADAEPTGDWAEVYVTEPGLVSVERLRTDLFLYVRD